MALCAELRDTSSDDIEVGAERSWLRTSTCAQIAVRPKATMQDEAWHEEQQHFQAVLQAWSDYLPYSVRSIPLIQLHMNNARRQSLYALPQAHQALLQGLHAPVPGPMEGKPAQRGFRAKLYEIDDRIRRNADVLEQMAHFCHSFLGILDESHQAASGPTNKVSERDQDRVRTAIKQMARDWGAQGTAERERVYQPIVEAVLRRRPPSEGRPPRVLVPGAGLGRLAFDFAQQGYCTQGNEFSYFMLIPAHFLLNCTQTVHEHTLFPYIHSGSNWHTSADMLQPVRVPDVLPSVLDENTDFSMVAGEFVEVYAKEEERGAWDVVATCFFIDTAKNILRYLEVINAVLPVGGLWVNAGPLLWHFEHDPDASVELTLEEVLELLPHFGFEMEEQRTLEPQTYTGIPNSMLSHLYTPVFWVCRKVRDHTMAPAV